MTRNEIDRMLGELADASLTKWEEGYVEQMRDQFDEGRALTPGQQDKLSDIYVDRVLGRRSAR